MANIFIAMGVFTQGELFCYIIFVQFIFLMNSVQVALCCDIFVFNHSFAGVVYSQIYRTLSTARTGESVKFSTTGVRFMYEIDTKDIHVNQNASFKMSPYLLVIDVVSIHNQR